jgi:hypothetical protein
VFVCSFRWWSEVAGMLAGGRSSPGMLASCGWVAGWLLQVVCVWRGVSAKQPVGNEV